MARIAFFHKDMHERLGLMSLSANLKKHGHDCEIFCGDGEEDIIRSILDSPPDIVAAGATTPEYLYSLEIFRKVKECDHKIRTLLGGHHATIYPDEAIARPEIDIICLGEGETPVVELMDRMDSGRDFADIAGLWVSRDGRVLRSPLRRLIEDLDAFPLADRELYYSKYKQIAARRTKPFMTSRGCPFQCSFCFNHYYQKMFMDSKIFVRHRSAESIIDEIAAVHQRHAFDWVHFHDSTFNSNRTFTREFLMKYKDRCLPGFICNVRADLLDEESVGLLKEAGCDRVTIGIESGNEKIRRKILKKSMTNEQLLTAAGLLRRYGIRVSTSNIVGLPGETIDNAFETIELNRKVAPETCNCHLLMPFPKTDIADYCIREGYLDEGFGTDWIAGPNQLMSIIKQKDMRRFVNLQKLFYYAVKHPGLVPFIKLLIGLPPNRLFVLAKNYPLMRRTQRFERGLSAKLSILHRWLSGEDF